MVASATFFHFKSNDKYNPLFFIRNFCQDFEWTLRNRWGSDVASWEYYKHGYVNLKVAIFVALGFLEGLLGTKLAIAFSDKILEKIFGGVLLSIVLKIIFF